MYSKIVFHTNSHGLCNRLRAMVGFQAMAKILAVPFYLCWTPDRSCPAKFSELFQTKDLYQLIDEKKVQKMSADNSVRIFRDLDWFTVVWEKHLVNQISKNDYERVVSECLLKLKPLPQIVEQCDHFLKKHQLINMYGLHIRMTDNTAAYRNWEKKVSVYSYDYDRFEAYIKDILTPRDTQLVAKIDNVIVGIAITKFTTTFLKKEVQIITVV